MTVTVPMKFVIPVILLVGLGVSDAVAQSQCKPGEVYVVTRTGSGSLNPGGGVCVKKSNRGAPSATRRTTTPSNNKER